MDFEVELTGGAPWGFRIQGGKEFHSPIKITFLKPGGKAAKSQGIKVGDCLVQINGVGTENLTHTQAEQHIKRAGASVKLSLHRKETPKPVPKPAPKPAPMLAPKPKTSVQEDRTDPPVNGDDDPPMTPRRRTCSVPAKPTKLAEIVPDKPKDPDWYKSMFKDIHQSVELKATPMGGEEVVTRAPVRKKASVYEMVVQKTNEYNAERSRRPSRQSLTGRPAPSLAVLALGRSHEEGMPLKQYEDNVFGPAEENSTDGQMEKEETRKTEELMMDGGINDGQMEEQRRKTEEEGRMKTEELIEKKDTEDNNNDDREEKKEIEEVAQIVEVDQKEEVVQNEVKNNEEEKDAVVEIEEEKKQVDEMVQIEEEKEEVEEVVQNVELNQKEEEVVQNVEVDEKDEEVTQNEVKKEEVVQIAEVAQKEEENTEVDEVVHTEVKKNEEVNEEDKENLKPAIVKCDISEEKSAVEKDNVPEPVFKSTPTKRTDAACESNPAPSKSAPDGELSEGEIVINTTTVTDHSDIGLTETKSLDIDRSGETELCEVKELVLLSAIASPLKSEDIKAIQNDQIPEFV